MSDPLVVDVHVHLFQQPDDPLRDGYEIWEYGPPLEVEAGHRGGTVDDLVDSLATRPDAHCVVLGMFVPDANVLSGPDGVALEAQRLKQENEWLLATTAASPNFTPLVATDPTVLGGRSGADQLLAAAARGSRGTKVHPILQGFLPTDPRMDSVYYGMRGGWTHGVVAFGDDQRAGATVQPFRLFRGSRRPSRPPSCVGPPWWSQLARDRSLCPGLPDGLVRPVRNHRVDRVGQRSQPRRARSIDPRYRF